MPVSSESTTVRSPSRDHVRGWPFAVLLVLVLTVSWGARLRSLSEWCADPAACFSEGVAASGSDSYYWFRNAREIQAHGIHLPARDPLREWPQGTTRGPFPIYSGLIALAATAFDGNVYRAGIALNIFFSSLFVVPLAFYGRAIGFPLAGLLGGFFGALGRLYVHRSSAARVDTDGGTLFFMALLALAIASLRPSASRRRNLVGAMAAGLCLAGFCRWYDQPGFWLVYGGTVALHLALGGFSRRDAIGLGLAFFLFSNPLSALPGFAGLTHFLRFYVVKRPDVVLNPFDYAYLTRDIAELKSLPVVETLSNVVDQPIVAGFGLAAFAVFALLRARAVVPMLPIVLLGLYALFGPMRFGVFLAPLVGIGIGAALHAGASFVQRWPATARVAHPAAAVAAVLGMAALFPDTGFELRTRPRIPARAVASLQRLARVLPPDAAVLASWGTGYVVTDVTGAATFNDGAEPDPLVHYLFSRALASDDPLELLRIVEVLSTFGQSELHAALDDAPDPEAAVQALLAQTAATAGNVVLLLQDRDVARYATFHRTGHWDFRRGRGPLQGYAQAHCRNGQDRRLRCRTTRGRSLEIDREGGRLSNGSRLWRAVELRADGEAVETGYAPGGQFGLVVLPAEPSGRIRAYLAPKPVFESNFNQLYLLGRFDPAVFEEIHHDLPFMRAFRIRATHPASPPSDEATPPSDRSRDTR